MCIIWMKFKNIELEKIVNIELVLLFFFKFKFVYFIAGTFM